MSDDSPEQARRKVLSVLAAWFGILLGANSISDIATAVKSPLLAVTTTTEQTTTTTEQTTTTTTDDETTTTTTEESEPPDPAGTFIQGSTSTSGAPHPLRVTHTVSATAFDKLSEPASVTAQLFVDDEHYRTFEFELDPGESATKEETIEFSRAGRHQFVFCTEMGCHEYEIGFSERGEGEENDEEDDNEEGDHVTGG